MSPSLHRGFETPTPIYFRGREVQFPASLSCYAGNPRSSIHALPFGASRLFRPSLSCFRRKPRAYIPVGPPDASHPALSFRPNLSTHKKMNLGVGHGVLPPCLRGFELLPTIYLVVVSPTCRKNPRHMFERGEWFLLQLILGRTLNLV